MAQNHYQTLEVTPTATQAEIKQSYRRLAKLFHPDSNRSTANHERITGINAAYEVLGDPKRRRSYDQQIGCETLPMGDRQQRAAAAQQQHQRRRQRGKATDDAIHVWLQRVYQPVNRKLGKVLNPLKRQIDALSADPFDDDLMEDFQTYLEDSRDRLTEAQALFQSMPNPASVASTAASLYHCLSQVGEGLDEFERFTCSYTEHYLHTGQELFRIAARLRQDAQASVRAIPR
jgi:molecular chaperone DnaJ